MKQTIRIALLMLLLCVARIGATAQEISGRCGESAAYSLEGGTLTISGTGTLYYPEEEEFDKALVKSVVVEEGITDLGSFTFEGSEELVSVELPKSMKIITDEAFSLCVNLATVSLPDSLTAIGTCLFYGCSSLGSISIPPTVSLLGNGAFADCSNLTEITLPDSLAKIGVECFYGCGFEEIIIPSGVSIIERGAFANSSITSIVIPSGVKVLSDVLFADCNNLVSVTLPDSLETIGGAVFCRCVALASIAIPEKVSFIDEWAFFECVSLMSFSFANVVDTIALSAFEGVSEQAVINGDTDLDSYFGTFYKVVSDSEGEYYVRKEFVTDKHGTPTTDAVVVSMDEYGINGVKGDRSNGIKVVRTVYSDGTVKCGLRSVM